MDGTGQRADGWRRKTSPPMNKVVYYLKQPSTYVIAVVAMIIGFAFSRYLSPLKEVAKKIPGSNA